MAGCCGEGGVVMKVWERETCSSQENRDGCASKEEREKKTSRERPP